MTLESLELSSYLEIVHVNVVNPDAVYEYVARHKGLAPVVIETVGSVRQTLDDAHLSIQIDNDPETLILYVRSMSRWPGAMEPLFEKLRTWNLRVAEQLAHTKAWFLVSLDLREHKKERKGP